MKKQKTIKKEIEFCGIGVHSGEFVSVKVVPSQINTGIRFCCSDNLHNCLQVGEIIPDKALHATVIKKDNFFVSTVEHLMSAITMLEIDNVVIQINGQEIPILDGSALPFVQEFLDIGIVDQDSKKHFLTPKNKLVFEGENMRFIELLPAKKLQNNLIDTNLYVSYCLNFKHPLIGKKRIDAVVDSTFFVEQIAPARTFGFLKQFPSLKKNGLARGATLGNTVVIGENEFLNEQRLSDEFAKHKLLDLLGDMGLLGKKLCGTLNAKNTGHSLNRLVIEHYINNPDMWELI